MMQYSVPQKVLFKHCDPAGIVFYPRYFEMINDAVEAFFAGELNWPFEELHKTGAVPTAHFDVTFTAPSRHGDHLLLELSVMALGGSSLKLKTEARCASELRFVAMQTLVLVNGKGRPMRWPEAIRRHIGEKTEGDV